MTDDSGVYDLRKPYSTAPLAIPEKPRLRIRKSVEERFLEEPNSKNSDVKMLMSHVTVICERAEELIDTRGKVIRKLKERPTDMRAVRGRIRSVMSSLKSFDQLLERLERS